MQRRRATDAVALAGWWELLDALPVAAWIVEARGNIVIANRRLHDLTGYAPGTLEGRPVTVLVPESGESRSTTCRRADGSSLAVDIARSPLPHNPGWTVAVLRDDTDRRRTEAELFRQATHDSLTGLSNRALLLDRLDRIRSRRQARHEPLTVLFVDLDRFKAVNDADGHAAGDDVLRVVAAALEHTFRPSDTIARVGGDEFVIVCDDTTADDGTALARRALAAVRAGVQALPYSAAGSVTASVGVVCASSGDEDPTALLDRADAAMYQAKRRGGDQLLLA